jgi:hypothetical protein
MGMKQRYAEAGRRQARDEKREAGQNYQMFQITKLERHE